METTTLTASSGRVLGMTSFGDPGAERVVVLAHPASGSSRFDPDPAVTAGRIVHLIAVDRPGSGLSEPASTGAPFTTADVAHDIAEVLAARGIDRVGVAGWSDGGRVALALAAAPSLVERVVVVSTAAPDAEVPWVAEARLAGADALDAGLDDDLGFALEDVVAKTLLLYGSKDPIGTRHANWYLKRLADARVEMDPKPGRLGVVSRWGRILSHLAPGSKPRRGVY